MGKKYTKKETQFVIENKENMSCREMGGVLGKSGESIGNKIRRLGAPRSEEAVKKLQSKNGRKSGLKNGLKYGLKKGQKLTGKIKFKRVPCRYPELGECWECTSHARRRGYPTLCRSGKHFTMSRYIWERKFGQIPNGMFVLHKCDNKSCINPEHLFLGTTKDNMQDAIQKGLRLGRRKKC